MPVNPSPQTDIVAFEFLKTKFDKLRPDRARHYEPQSSATGLTRRPVLESGSGPPARARIPSHGRGQTVIGPSIQVWTNRENQLLAIQTARVLTSRRKGHHDDSKSAAGPGPPPASLTRPGPGPRPITRSEQLQQ
jgi:hypothetical protein